MWLDYRFLTKEMVKFLGKKDMDLFYELMNQREQLQVMIDQIADDGFKASTEAQEIFGEIQRDNQLITHNLQFQINLGKRQHQVAAAYDGEILTHVSSMNWKR